MPNDTDSNQVDMSESKRQRTSPRSKVLDSVFVKIGEMMTEWKQENNNDAEVAVSVLTALKERLNGLDEPSKPEYVGRHFIGVKETGVRTAFTANYPPSKRSHGVGTESNFVSIIGPFKKKNDVIAYLANPNAEMTVLF
jgi:hypothetical protein